MSRFDDEGVHRLVGRSAAMHNVRHKIERFARHDLPVLVRGPTGTGKDVAARALHAHGRRATGPLVALNCATLSAELADSQLFGHVRGAFTGAHRDHCGAFVRATGGTLFLDEVGELPLALQARLLRALENAVVTPIGSEIDVPVDVRVVAATHRDLEAMVAAGTFREDLFHRLSILTLRIPPLSVRRDDIPDLLDHLAPLAAEQLGHRVTVTPAAVEAARHHAWPGNVRELRNALLRAAALSGGVVDAEDLVPAALPPPPMQRVEAQATPARDTIAIPRGNYHAMNHALLRAAVRRHGSINRAALALGIPRSTLSAWLRRLDRTG